MDMLQLHNGRNGKPAMPILQGWSSAVDRRFWEGHKALSRFALEITPEFR
ncbi:MAG: hypothetical protein KDA73_11065 [Rhodobacteraceae bacterium]|nr:hypothetical protein [Paracoccaceae bacterium]